MYKIELADPVTEAETRALAIANTFRDSIGEEIITGIIPGERSSGTDCVLARTFNANCSVGYESKNDGRTDPESGDFLDAEFGYASFHEEEHAKAFAAAVNKHRLDDEPESVVTEEISVPNYALAGDVAERHRADRGGLRPRRAGGEVLRAAATRISAWAAPS